MPISPSDLRKLLEILPTPHNIVYGKPTVNVNEKVNRLLQGEEIQVRTRGTVFLSDKLLKIGMDVTYVTAFSYITITAITLRKNMVLFLTVPCLIFLAYQLKKDYTYMLGDKRNLYGIIKLQNKKVTIRIKTLDYRLELEDIDEIYLIRKTTKHIIIIYKKQNKPTVIDLHPDTGDKIYSLLTILKEISAETQQVST